MCGIAGIVAFDRTVQVDPGRVVRMRDELVHRGPDGAGLWCQGPVGLGHRRLAIVDVAAGQQPMSNEDGTVWVTFNGEIYNHAELRTRLIARGHHYRTRCDTETIVHAYEEWGAGCVERLEGMFAFALWDCRDERLLLARDRFGIKPLYVAETGEAILFASEIKALVAGGVRPALDRSILPEYLAQRFVSGESTFFSNVRRFPPGHVWTWSSRDGRSLTRYWRVPPPGATPVPMRTAAERVRTELTAAVSRHLMSDVPLGVFLSGGLDSSALAAMAARMVDGPLQTFSVGFAEAEGNELPYARRVAAAVGADHRDVVVSTDEYFDVLPRLIWSQDEPLAFSSSVPLYFVSKLARDYVTVVLTGEGADELFLGYNRYRVAWWNQRLGAPYWRLPSSVRQRVRAAVRRLPSGVRRYAMRTFLGVEPGSRPMFDNFAVFTGDRASGLLAPGVVADADPYAGIERCYEEAEGGLLDRLSALDQQTYLVELLMKQDRMSMAASIESRVPFLDDRLAALVTGLPAGVKLRGWTTKAVLRAAVAGLVPRVVLTRRKMGFPVPLAGWFRGSHHAVVDEFVTGRRALARGLFRPGALRALAAEHQSGAANHAERLWLLVNLEIWQRLFCDGESPIDVMRPVRRRAGRHHASHVDQGRGALAVEHRRPPAHVRDPVRVVGRA